VCIDGWREGGGLIIVHVWKKKREVKSWKTYLAHDGKADEADDRLALLSRHAVERGDGISRYQLIDG
jgi:hypothetical protein